MYPPGPDVLSHLKSLSNSERAWIRKFGTPLSYGRRTYRAPWELPPHLQIPSNHIRLLDQYDDIVPYLIAEDTSFHRPVLTLRDSHQNNIFLSHEALERDGTIQISAVIDWQHTAVLPLYLTAFIPKFIQQAIPAPGQPQEQFTKEIAYLRKAYHALYYETGRDVDWATIVMSEIDGSFPLSQTVPAGAERCWHRGYANLKKRLIDIGTRWVQLIGPGVPFPRPELCSDPEEAVRAEEDDVKWTEVAGELEAIQRFVGVGSDWGVSNEDYEGAVSANRELCKAWVESLTEEDKRGMGGVDPVDICPVRP
ncbi:protein kinase subdomain-containing protein PKL/CAK/Fmp29 [Coprinopsis cinerea AmutBmut pab1-1]|nr:protein kinase subdomain-containing protein PKL/CAK/Fmp29 [Coprinopsis cinerea AmutBmut pab1-1]